MHKILVITLYFPLDTLHVSDCVSPSTGATFCKLHIAFGIFGYVWLLCGYRKNCPVFVLLNTWSLSAWTICIWFTSCKLGSTSPCLHPTSLDVYILCALYTLKASAYTFLFTRWNFQPVPSLLAFRIESFRLCCRCSLYTLKASAFTVFVMALSSFPVVYTSNANKALRFCFCQIW